MRMRLIRFAQAVRYLLGSMLICMPGIVLVFALGGPGRAAGQDEVPSSREANEQQARLEAEFQEMLSGATLVGHFTVTGAARPPREERYNLHSVEKLPNGRWLFRSRIRYGDHDVTVPLPLPVEWAGNTPVIVVDNVPVPGLGTFDARVMFFRNHYAGYWSGGDRGGHLYGIIERANGEQAAADTGTADELGDEE